jgi:hypothetical protein
MRMKMFRPVASPRTHCPLHDYPGYQKEEHGDSYGKAYIFSLRTDEFSFEGQSICSKEKN